MLPLSLAVAPARAFGFSLVTRPAACNPTPLRVHCAACRVKALLALFNDVAPHNRVCGRLRLGAL
jgi:hypothetical protein